jgi:hypothetical protein
MSKLTTEQRVVLAFFAAHRCAAMRFRGKWLWISEVRNDPAIAAAFIKDRADDPYPENDRDTAMLRAWMAADTGGRRQ